MGRAAQKPNRINVEVGDIRHFIEILADGNSLAIYGNQLFKEALHHKFFNMTIAEIVNKLNPETLSELTGIEFERIADIAVGQSPPTNSELVLLAKELKSIGLDAQKLKHMRDRDYQE
ncbi:MAG: hypothetical protein F6K24_02485 [Okeania sp. SIO2D1]|nr:hypothetical protein [Okeania sp. SIO2D1]